MYAHDHTVSLISSNVYFLYFNIKCEVSVSLEKGNFIVEA